MTYQVLARRWRPRDFESLVGQEHVVRALTHALDHGRLHHAYLFTGTRGVGKTTLSRILAKSLNCVGPDGRAQVSSRPCGQCEPCTAIDAGRFIDYIEMDAASNRGVDDMVQLLERAVYAPSSARFKVYMIDEVHMLSNHAFNAMLKTLEEPPDYVKFVLATTDPQRVPVTVLSRCLQFNLKQMAPAEVGGHLADVLAREGIAAEPAAVRLLAHAARGSMRDGLSLLDQAIAYSGGTVSLEAVRGMLGAIDTTLLVRVLDAVAEGDAAAALAVADEMAGRSLSFGQALRDLAGLLHRIALAQAVEPATDGDEVDGVLSEAVARLARRLAPEDVQLHYQIALHGRGDLHLAPDEHAGFTMTLLRMLAFRPVEPAAPRAGARAALAGARPPRTQAAPAPRPGPANLRDAAGAPPAVGSQAPEAGGASPGFDGDWPALAGRLPVRGLARELAIRSELLGVEGDRFRLRTPNRSLADPETVERLRAALAAHLGRAVRIEVDQGSASQPEATALGRADRARSERQQAAEAAIRADPVVRELIDAFGARIDPSSVRPEDPSGDRQAPPPRAGDEGGSPR